MGWREKAAQRRGAVRWLLRGGSQPQFLIGRTDDRFLAYKALGLQGCPLRQGSSGFVHIAIGIGYELEMRLVSSYWGCCRLALRLGPPAASKCCRYYDCVLSNGQSTKATRGFERTTPETVSPPAATTLCQEYRSKYPKLASLYIKYHLHTPSLELRVLF